MQREHDLFLKDILLAIRKIENYTEKLSYEEFLKRDILTHEYFGINFEIIWDVIMNKIPDLKKM